MEEYITKAHGEWLQVFQAWTNEQWIECSCCGMKAEKYHKNKYKYCPHCGARMDGEKE